MKNRGMTLIELLIGMTISVMIFMLSANIIANLFYADTKSKQTQQLESAKSLIESELSDSIRWSEMVTLGASRIALDEVEFTVEDGRLLKNGEPITTQSVIIDSFTATNFSASDSVKGVEIELQLKHANSESVRELIRLVVSQRQLVISEGSDG